MFDCQAGKLDPYECPSCKFKTFMKIHLHRHWKLVHEPSSGASPHDLAHFSKIFACRICETTTHSKLIHLGHKRFCIQRKIHSCDSCPYVTAVASKLHQHKCNSHPTTSDNHKELRRLITKPPIVKVENVGAGRPIKGGYKKDKFFCGYCDLQSSSIHTVKAHFVHDHMNNQVLSKNVVGSHVGRVIYFRVLAPD
ncbi:hypothetical protein TcasGA2_TC006264 [Tribolium castaneum]|uniref:C2H2-type domain-containing protein n=1 Tax=Tribolium castaneum TaxID=7070 RepID=D6WVQ9_TRICA|nr:hypothetical protein TcasGA2_TC006264 [Tribolium castaneum]